MEKLKGIIEQYGRWKDYEFYIEHIEGFAQTDFSIAIESAKALLEAIGKEICKHYGVDLGKKPSVNSVIKKALSALGYSGKHPITQISSSLATIGQSIGDIRNDVGAISHGRTSEELRARNEKVDNLTKTFLIDSTEIVASFLISNFEKDNPRVPLREEKVKLIFSACEEFNNLWDETYGEFVMGEYTYPASEVLFHLDYPVYEEEYKTFEAVEE